MFSIFNLFKKKEYVEDEELDSLLDEIEESEESIDYDSYPDPEIIDNGSDKTILVLDDLANMWYLYNKDIEAIKEKKGRSVLEDFNIVKCIGPKAGFTAHKYIFNNYKKIDYAILDITLGYGVKLTSGEYIEHDGVDVFLELYKRNPDMKFIFCTSHTLNRKNPTVGYFFTKFETETGLDFKDYYVNKNVERYKHIHKLLYGEDDVQT